MEAGDRKRHAVSQIVAEPAEIRRQHDLERRAPPWQTPRRRAAAPAVRYRIEIENQAGFIELHPFGAAFREFLQNLDIDRQQRVEQRQRIKRRIGALAKLEEGDRTDQNRSRLIAEALASSIFLDRLARGERECLPLAELRHHVVVVGVEPFGHFLCGRAMRRPVFMMGMSAAFVMAGAFRAARHREIGGKRNLAAFPAIYFRYCADHHAGVENLVVQ